MEAPVCLIENLQNGSLRVNDEAVDILSKIIQPLIVVAIVGMYRTGKSYLMNKLAGVQKGFELGAAIQAKTKGIWMWCVPHPTVKDHTLVLLDTEGLGNVHKGDKKNDLKIFCLSVLLSSALIYNGRGTIDEDAVEKLHFVGELAEMIKIKSKDNENNEGQFSRHFPAFIWVVRDFTLMLELDGKEITEDEYLENALLPQKPESTEECNRCRDTIRMYFSTRKCFVFDLPSGNKKVLQRMDEVSEEEVSPGFMAQCQTFCEYVYKNAEVKLLDDIKPVCGKILGQLVYKYTEAITSFSVVCMEDTLISISEMENKVAVQKATEHYEKMMREEGRRFPTETLKEFLELSAQHEKEALQIFMNKSFKDSNLSFHTQFMCNVQEKKEEFSKINEKASHNYCKQLIKKHSRDLEEALEKDLYSNPDGYQKFQRDMALIEKRYNNEPRKGVEAASVLHDFIMSKHASRMFILRREVDNLYTQNKKRENETQEFKSANETMVAKVFTFNQPTEDNLNTLNKKREKEIQKLKSENEAMVAEDRERTFLMHLNLLLERAKNDNSKRQEILDHVIQSKCWELDIYMFRGLASHARTYEDQIKSLCRESSALEDHQCLQHTADLFKENAAVMLRPTLAGSYLGPHEMRTTSMMTGSYLGPQEMRTTSMMPGSYLRPHEMRTTSMMPESLLDALNSGNTQQNPMLGTHNVGIFSISPQRDYYWLRDLLKSAQFQDEVQEIKYFYIPESDNSEFRWDIFISVVSKCTFGILYQNIKMSRSFFNDVAGKHVHYLFDQLGKNHVLEVTDDMDISSRNRTAKLLKEKLRSCYWPEPGIRQ